VSQTYPLNLLEVFVVDGMSEDKTRGIVKDYIKKHPFIRLLDNPKKVFPSANNIGIKKSKGEIIMIFGAHAVYPKDYVEKCVENLKKYDADDVGGQIKILPAKDNILAKAIALSLGGRFGKGREEKKEDRWTDTVFGGCYKRKVFEKIGLFNEDLVGSSDMEFNIRLKKAGGKILMIPDIVIYYYPKSNLKDFFLHNIRDGIWAVLPLKFAKKPLKLRHYLPLIFILFLPLSIWPYIPLACYFSAKIARRERNGAYLFIMPIVFATRHIGYGLGSIWGMMKLLRE